MLGEQTGQAHFRAHRLYIVGGFRAPVQELEVCEFIERAAHLALRQAGQSGDLLDLRAGMFEGDPVDRLDVRAQSQDFKHGMPSDPPIGLPPWTQGLMHR